MSDRERYKSLVIAAAYYQRKHRAWPSVLDWSFFVRVLAAYWGVPTRDIDQDIGDVRRWVNTEAFLHDADPDNAE